MTSIVIALVVLAVLLVLKMLGLVRWSHVLIIPVLAFFIVGHFDKRR